MKTNKEWLKSDVGLGYTTYIHYGVYIQTSTKYWAVYSTFKKISEKPEDKRIVSETKALIWRQKYMGAIF